MKLEILQERKAKAEAKLEKKAGTIEKKTVQIEKTKAKLAKLGYAGDVKRNELGNLRDTDLDLFYDVIDLVWKRDGLEEDVERNTKELENIKLTIAKYDEQIAKAIETGRVLETEVPEMLKKMARELVEYWDKTDIERRDYMRERYKELGYTEFIKNHSYRNYEFMQTSNDEIHVKNERDAKILVLDLYNRVKDITGPVKDWAGLYATVGTHGFTVLNGIVRGENGDAKVESIYAGGYNIQRLHVRVLVTAF